jgi:hypothetical protein
MNYIKFKSLNRIDYDLLLALGALKSKSLIMNIDLHPDYDLTNYDKHVSNTYFIKSELDFSDEFTAVLSANIGKSATFHCDDIERISKEFNLTREDNESASHFLQRVAAIDSDVIYQGNGTQHDGFELNELKVDFINNKDKKVIVLGGFFGDNYSIDPSDWDLVSELDLSGIPKELNGELYLELLAESYSLSELGNYKLAFFLAYSALECYLNSQVNPNNDKVRLKDSFSELFKNKFSGNDLNNHIIYSSISGEFTPFTLKRNEIAHGKSKVEISKEYASDFLLFSLITIVSNKHCISDFKSLAEKVT